MLYNLSVGIERLLKVAIILIEHYDQIDLEQFEESLISHSTIDLANRVDSKQALNLSKVHREFLSILSKFYKSYRYGRYSLSAVPKIFEEKRLLLEFVSKHLNIGIAIENELSIVENTDQIRRFIGKVVKKICDETFRVVRQRARDLNIYTSEIRGDSKALKVFYGKRLDFLDEDLKKKEILLFLMSEKSKGPHKNILETVEALNLDPAMVPHYIKALLNDAHFPYAGGEVEELYTEIANVRERRNFLSVMDYEYLSYSGEEDA